MNRISIDGIQRTLRHWGGCTLLRPIEGGYRNAAFLVEQHDALFVAKTTRRSEQAVAWLVSVHESAEQAGFVVPKLIPSLNGALVVNFVTLETFIEGRHPGERHFRGVASPLKRFHELTRHVEQRPGFASSTQLLEAERGGDVNFGAMPRALVALCRKAWRNVADLSQSVIHGDINPNNVLVTADGRYGLVDWDEARVDASVFDTLALSRAVGDGLSAKEAEVLDAWEVAVSWLIEPDHARCVAENLWGADVAL